MGKRKAKRKPTAKKKATLDTTFTCPFCNHENAIECKMDRNHNIGYVSCRICDASFQSVINYLSEPIDVYSDWIDACEESNK